MKLKVTVDGKAYEVDVEIVEQEAVRTAPPIPVAGGAAAAAAPRAAARPAGGGAAEEPVADEAKAVRSPIAGNVTQVLVEAGKEVAAEETVIVLEAMKMETSITAPMAGKIKSVRVAPGDAVKSGQALLEFE